MRPGILSGSLYYHFDSKESIGDEILSGFINAILADYREAVASGGNPRAVIEQIVRSTSHTLTRHRAALAMLENDWNYFTSQPRFGYLRTSLDEIERTWITQLERGQHVGLFRADLDAKLTYRLIRDMLWIPAHWRRGGESAPGRWWTESSGCSSTESPRNRRRPETPGTLAMRRRSVTVLPSKRLVYSRSPVLVSLCVYCSVYWPEVRSAELDGKVALITGGARGMGKSHVRHFVAEGARVVLGDVLDDKGAAVAAGLPAESCRYVHQDVTSEPDWVAAVSTALETFGRLDVLVNNAGSAEFGSIAEMPLAEFRHVLEVNAVGCWLGMKAAIDPMTAAGGGSIINISSIEGFTGRPGLAAYSASKFAVRGMTKAAAQELGRFGIRVNSVHPGGVLTRHGPRAGTGTFNQVDAEAFVKSMPLARFARPTEISRLVGFLASDESSYSTGSEFTADGGVLSGPGY